MDHSTVPILVIRADTLSLVFVNGRIVGECSRTAHVAIPISDTGDYYLCAAPLEGSWRNVTRKLAFECGALSEQPAPDVAVCVWPGGVFEAMLFTGAYVEEELPEEEQTQELRLAFAFAEAVRDNREEDAVALLDPELAQSLDFDDIRDFLGDFAYPRAPFSDQSGKVIGLVSYADGSISEARLFEFDYRENHITNVKEY